MEEYRISRTDFDSVIDQMEIQMDLTLTEEEIDKISEILNGRFLGD